VRRADRVPEINNEAVGDAHSHEKAGRSRLRDRPTNRETPLGRAGLRRLH
jgi:hypothetical protein